MDAFVYSECEISIKRRLLCTATIISAHFVVEIDVVHFADV